MTSQRGLQEADLAELRRDLERLAGELQAALTQSADAARPVELDQPALGRVSRVDAIQQQKMVEASRDAQRARLRLVQAALQRFESDDYGDCAACEEPIGRRRLKARPETVLCIGCQEKRERS